MSLYWFLVLTAFILSVITYFFRNGWAWNITQFFLHLGIPVIIWLGLTFFFSYWWITLIVFVLVFLYWIYIKRNK